MLSSPTKVKNLLVGGSMAAPPPLPQESRPQTAALSPCPLPLPSPLALSPCSLPLPSPIARKLYNIIQ